MQLTSEIDSFIRKSRLLSLLENWMSLVTVCDNAQSVLDWFFALASSEYHGVHRLAILESGVRSIPHSSVAVCN